MATSPTQLSLKHFRKQGYECQVVEHWNQWARVRQDLFGVIDIVAMRNGELAGVQTTSQTNHSARRNKILDSDLAKIWIQSGAKLFLQSWKKPANRWEFRLEEIRLQDFKDGLND
jgi:Holliday junction resolvase-like predicted endonuclease